MVKEQVLPRPHVSMHKVSFVRVTAIVPKAWRGWFFAELAESRHVSWGDADHTLVAAKTFAEICEDALEAAIDRGWTSRSHLRRFLNRVRQLDGILVDLES